jgi:hypothetical protein
MAWRVYKSAEDLLKEKPIAESQVDQYNIMLCLKKLLKGLHFDDS